MLLCNLTLQLTEHKTTMKIKSLTDNFFFLLSSLKVPRLLTEASNFPNEINTTQIEQMISWEHD